MLATSQPKYGLVNSLAAQAGHGDALAAILLAAARLVATAPGCQLYLVSRDPQNEAIIWISEVWDTKYDHAQSLQTAGVRELISQALPLLAGPPTKGLELQVIGGKGPGFSIAEQYAGVSG